jgi:hypothetical protein
VALWRRSIAPKLWCNDPKLFAQSVEELQHEQDQGSGEARAALRVSEGVDLARSLAWLNQGE